MAATSATQTAKTEANALQEQAQRHLWMHFTQMGSFGPDHEVPIIVRGEGCYVWDDHGNRYLDGLSALFCVNSGHGRSELGDAMAAQVQRARLHHRLELRPSPRDRAGDADLDADAGRPEPGLLHQQRIRGRRVGDQAGAQLPPLQGKRPEDQAGRARDRVPRHHPWGSQRHRHPGASEPVRAARTGRGSRSEHEQLSLARGPRSALGRGPDRGADPLRGAGDGGRRDPRAVAKRRRLHPAAGGLLPAGQGDLRQVRRPADLR